LSNNRVESLKKILDETKESFSSIQFALLGEFFYSFFLVTARNYLALFPIIAGLVPVMAAVRGGIYASLASKASTRIHLGLSIHGIRDWWVRKTYFNIFLVLIMISFFVSVLIGVFHYSFYAFLESLYASMSSLAIAHIFLVPATIFLAIKVFSRGLNPDDVLGPLITLLGDISTVPALIFVTILFYEYGSTIALVMLGIIILFNIGLTLFSGKKGDNWLDKSVLRQLGGAMILALVIEVVGGLILSKNIDKLVLSVGLLGTLPIAMQAGGAIASIQVSRISTFIHIGTYPPTLKPNAQLIKEYVRGLFLVIPSYTTASIIGYASSSLAGGTASFWNTISPTIVYSLLMFMLIPLLSHLVSSISFIKGWDPDNTGIPILTSIIDLTTITYFSLIA